MLKNGQGQNAFYGDKGIVGVYFDAMIGEHVRGAPFREEYFETVAIGGQGASGIVAETFANHFERAIEPDRDAAAGFDQRAIGRLHKSASAQGDDRRSARFHLSDTMTDYFRFYGAEMRLALFGKYLRDGAVFAGFDFGVDINEGPADLRGQSAANGGFSASHETHEIEARDRLSLDAHSCGSETSIARRG
jgi:hypothetical protein